jgi:hypothetical protein
MYDSRQFAIFSTTEIDKVDFTQVCETSAETLRRSVDGEKTFVKWDQAPFDPTPYEITNPETNEIETIIPTEPQPPSFIQELTTLDGIYTYEEILEILGTPEWSAPMPVVEEPTLVRARNADGTFRADDPSTPDVNEAWEEA